MKRLGLYCPRSCRSDHYAPPPRWGSDPAHDLLLPSIVPSEGFFSALTHPDYTGGFLINTILPAIGWIAWATFALAILIEIPAAFTKIKLPKIPGLQIQRKAAASLLSAVVIGITALFGGGGAMAAEPAPHDVAPVSVSAASDSPEGNAHATGSVTENQKYEIQKGDSLWKIAENKYGDPDRYTEIAEASDLTDPDIIHTGEILVVPDVKVDAPASTREPKTAPEPKDFSEATPHPSAVDDEKIQLHQRMKPNTQARQMIPRCHQH